MTSTPTACGRRLNACCEHRGITLDQLASMSIRLPKFVYKLSNDPRADNNPAAMQGKVILRFIDLARALVVDPWWLLGLSGHTVKPAIEALIKPEPALDTLLWWFRLDAAWSRCLATKLAPTRQKGLVELTAKSWPLYHRRDLLDDPDGAHPRLKPAWKLFTTEQAARIATVLDHPVPASGPPPFITDDGLAGYYLRSEPIPMSPPQSNPMLDLAADLLTKGDVFKVMMKSKTTSRALATWAYATVHIGEKQATLPEVMTSYRIWRKMMTAMDGRDLGPLREWHTTYQGQIVPFTDVRKAIKKVLSPAERAGLERRLLDNLCLIPMPKNASLVLVADHYDRELWRQRESLYEVPPDVRKKAEA